MGHTMNVNKGKTELKEEEAKEGQVIVQRQPLKSCSFMKDHCFSWECVTESSLPHAFAVGTSLSSP